MFKKGQKLITIGLDENCHQVTIQVEFDHYLPSPQAFPTADGGESILDCIVVYDGMKTMTDSQRMNSIN